MRPYLYRSNASGLPSLLAALSVAACFGVTLTLFAAPGSLSPGAILAVSLAATSLAVIRPEAFGSPLRAALLPLILLAAGAVSAGVVVAADWSGWTEAPDNLERIGTAETAWRFLVVSAALAAAAFTCFWRSLGMWIGMLSVVIPALILFQPLESIRRDDEPTALLGFSVLTLAWVIFSRAFQWLEKTQEPFGGRLVAAVLRLQDPDLIESGLRLLEVFNDPRGRLRDATEQLLNQADSAHRRSSFHKIADLLDSRQFVLSPACLKKMRSALNGHPEVRLLLSKNDLLLKRPGRAVDRLRDLPALVGEHPKLSWIVQAGRRTFEGAEPPELGRLLDDCETAAWIASFIQRKDDRPQVLRQLLESLVDSSRTLPERSRQLLPELVDKRPETRLVLAEDHAAGGRPAEALLQLAGLTSEVAYEVTWLVDETLAAWSRREAEMRSPALQLELWQRTRKGLARERELAYSALVTTALQAGLAADLVSALKSSSTGQDQAAFLLACDSVHSGGLETAFPQLLDKLSLIPEMLLRRGLLDKLKDWACRNEIGAREWFFKAPRRPQVLETASAPLTSIYGSRIACWTFSELEGLEQLPQLEGFSDIQGGQFRDEILAALGARRRPKMFVVTGHGPKSICARVSAILSDLASQRNCGSDFIAAGISFFDLTLRPSERILSWSPTQLHGRVRKLADGLHVSELLAEADVRSYVQSFAASAPAQGFDSARESLRQLETRSGFVVNQDLDESDRRAAVDFLEQRTPDFSARSMPLVLDWGRGEKPLTVRLDLQCLGIEDYHRVVRRYRSSLVEEIRQEWQRRRRLYEQWAHEFRRSYWQLKAALEREGPAVLLSRTLYLHYFIDPVTATQTRLDPPKPESELEHLRKMPLAITSQLCWWAWAEHRLENLESAAEIRPHWEKNCLIDAFLRGWPLPFEDEDLNAARENWEKQWRPLALLALDGELKQLGLELSDIAVENCFFRIDDEDDTHLTLSLHQVWDPSHDPLPRNKNGAILFASAFGARRREMSPAPRAQQKALVLMRQVVGQTEISSRDLRQALGQDSGNALDLLLDSVRGLFVKASMEEEVASIINEVLEKVDPLVRFGLKRKLNNCNSYSELLKLADGCARVGLKRDSVPDFEAWQLYLIGEVVRQIVSSFASQPALSAAARPAEGLSLPSGFDRRSLPILSEASSFQIIEMMLNGGTSALSASAALKVVRHSFWIDRVKQTYARLQEKDAEYASACLRASGPPPASQRRRQLSPSESFTGERRVLYDLAKGDTAFRLALAVNRESDSSDGLKAASEFSIPECFEELLAARRNLVENWGKHRDRADAVSRKFAKDLLSDALTEIVDLAEASYREASLRDVWHGCGWVRLAQLKWWTAQFREALSTLIGPAPKPDLQTVQLPLALAVKTGGGTLHFEVSETSPWPGPEKTTWHVNRRNGELTLEAESDGSEIGQCIFRNLSEFDFGLLSEFFQKYEPAMLKSPEKESFEEWLSRVQTPSLGWRGALARAVAEGAEFALLTACASLGMPASFRPWPEMQGAERPGQWSEADVVVRLHWG